MSGAHDSPSFGLLLRRNRQAAGLTQEALAERARLSVRAVSDLERGLSQRPRKDTLALLAEALALTSIEHAALEVAASRPIAHSPVHDTHLLPAATPPPLVGRTHEVALLDGHLGGDGPPLLLLAGEPGIGKSRLLAETARRGQAGGWAVLQGGCQRRGGQDPYAPLLEALERHIQRHSPEQRRVALQGCAWLVRLLPELSAEQIEPLPTWTVPPEQERRLVFKAVVRYLANVAGPAGALLILDDLQWAGADALDLLATLARAAEEAPLRVVGAYRDTEAPPEAPLAVTVADLAQAGLAQQHTVTPLSAGDVGQLLDQLTAGIEDTLRAQVAQRTGGVPFFVVSCAQALRLEGNTWRGADAVPWTVAQSVRQRVAALSPRAQEALGIAAVLGRVAQPTLLAVVAAQPEDAVIDALEGAHRLRLLEESDGAYRFAHDLVREVVEAEVGSARRVVLHRRAAEVLEQGPGEPPVALLAYHYSRSDAQDKALFYLERAGDQAEAQFAHAAAAAQYQELIARLEASRRPTETSRVREKLGTALGIEAHYDTALAVLELAADGYQTAGDLESLGRVTAQIGHIHDERGTAGEGLARVQPLVELLDGQDQIRGLALCLQIQADLLGVTGRLNEALVAAERATVLARALGDAHMIAMAETKRGYVLGWLGRASEARTVMQDAAPLAEAAGDFHCLSRVFNWLAHFSHHQGDFQACTEYIDRALALAERIGDARNIAFDLMHRGLICFCSGDWRQARAEAERAASICRQIGAFYVSGYPFMVLGFICFGEGDWAEATEHLEHAVALADARAPEALLMAQSVLAEIDLVQGHPAAAQARVRALLERFGPENCNIAYLLPKLAWAHLELGNLAQAEAVAAQAVAFAQGIEDFLNLVEAVRVQAMVLMAQQRWAEAEQILAGVLLQTQAKCYPWGEARVLDTYGLLHIRKGETGPARARLEAALILFRRLGAQRDVERLEHDLQRLVSAAPSRSP